MASDIAFYKRHYGGAIMIDSFRPDITTVAALRSGGRYSLVAERLRSTGNPMDVLVELGCGGGQVLMHLAHQYSFSRVVGVDVAFNEPSLVGGVEFRNINLNDKWPFEDGSINHIVAMMIFEHLFDPFHCFYEVRRTLSPTGTAYVNLPLVTGIKNRMRLAAGLLPVTSVRCERWFEDREWDGNHLHYFSLPAIRRLAEVCKLSVTDVRGIGPFHALKTRFPTLLANEITFSLKHIV